MNEMKDERVGMSLATCPELNSNDAKYEEDKEAEEEHVAEHGQGVQQQHHQDPHAFSGEEREYSDVSNLLQNEPTWNTVDRSERSEHANGSDRWEVQLLHIKAVLKSAGEEEDKVKKVTSW